MAMSTFCLTGLGMTLQRPTNLKEPIVNDEGYMLTTLRHQDPVFKEIVIDFNNAGLTVHNIEQLNNHQLWQKYENEKRTVTDRKPQDPDFKMNEKYLYHGTTAQKDFICAEGLDARLSKKGRRFGQGIYFSDNPEKCVTYAEKNEKKSFILLARVILGCSKVYPQGKTEKLLTREPEKTRPFKGWRFYDSIVGCPKDFKEFVIYRNDRALIEYFITYSKKEDSPLLSSIPRANNISTSSSFTTLYTNTKLLPKSAPVIKSSLVEDDQGDTTDEDDNDDGDSSNSEKHDGFSSDSSLDVESDDRKMQSKYSNKGTTISDSPQNGKTSGETVLTDKRREFTYKTGEGRACVIESFLSAAGLDVNRAIQLFKDKEKKKGEMERQYIKQELNSRRKSVDKAEEEVKYVAPSTVSSPLDDPDKWNQIPEADKETILDAVLDNFLTVVGLDDSCDNKDLGRKILFSCKYDLDTAIVSYYESL